MKFNLLTFWWGKLKLFLISDEDEVAEEEEFEEDDDDDDEEPGLKDGKKLILRNFREN